MLLIIILILNQINNEIMKVKIQYDKFQSSNVNLILDIFRHFNC